MVQTVRDTSVTTCRHTSVSIQVYAQLQRAGHKPDMVTYNVLMDAHIKAAAVAASFAQVFVCVLCVCCVCAVCVLCVCVCTYECVLCVCIRVACILLTQTQPPP